MPDLHDMGGQTEHFGPIVREPNEPVFHERWERRVFGMSPFVLMLFGQNLDAFRFEMEQLPRDEYLSSYYRRWLEAFEVMLIRAGYLEGGQAEPGRRRGSRARLAVTARAIRWISRPRFPPWLCAQVLPRIFGSQRPTRRGPRFSVGDQVRVRSERGGGHTRQPRYVTGKPGLITAHHGAMVFPDAHALHRRERPRHVYTVVFEARDLWGAEAEEGTEVRVDLFEPYLEPA